MRFFVVIVLLLNCQACANGNVVAGAFGLTKQQLADHAWTCSRWNCLSKPGVTEVCIDGNCTDVDEVIIK